MAVGLWWQRGVIYQIYPRSYQDTNGDGVGDIPGITRRLDYLADTLGIDAIWISPFYPSPMADFGYDVADYTDIDPVFGTLADAEEMIRRAHARNIRVIVDFVPNHSSDRHPWFLESRSSRDNPKRNWYVWRDPKPDGSPPNNWLSHFGGGAWEWDGTTGQYYLHSFLKEQPDLNWRNPNVERAMLDVLRFWMERGVDGFRIDVAHHIMKDPELRDNPVNPEKAESPHEYERQFHVYDKSHTDVHEAFRKIRRTLDEYEAVSPRFAVGEIYEKEWPTWVSYYGAELDELHMPYNFTLILAPWRAEEIRALVDAQEAALPPGAWPNFVLGNHDQHRLASRVGREQARIGMMLLLTLRGTPTIYYGDEIGMCDVEIGPEHVHDPVEKNEPGLGLGRDPERSPMQWDGGPNAGFCPPGAMPWLPIGADYLEVNVASEMEDPASFLSLTRRLLALRRDTDALHSGSYRPLNSSPGTFVYLREAEGSEYAVALNFTAEPREVALPRAGSAVISTGGRQAGDELDTRVQLAANEGIVVRLTG